MLPSSTDWLFPANPTLVGECCSVLNDDNGQSQWAHRWSLQAPLRTRELPPCMYTTRWRPEEAAARDPVQIESNAESHWYKNNNNNNTDMGGDRHHHPEPKNEPPEEKKWSGMKRTYRWSEWFGCCCAKRAPASNNNNFIRPPPCRRSPGGSTDDEGRAAQQPKEWSVHNIHIIKIRPILYASRKFPSVCLSVCPSQCAYIHGVG